MALMTEARALISRPKHRYEPGLDKRTHLLLVATGSTLRAVLLPGSCPARVTKGPRPPKNLAVLSTNAEIMVNYPSWKYGTGRLGSPSPSHNAGWSSPVAREAHNLEVAGSNPVPATHNPRVPSTVPWGLFLRGFPISSSPLPARQAGESAEERSIGHDSYTQGYGLVVATSEGNRHVRSA